SRGTSFPAEGALDTNADTARSDHGTSACCRRSSDQTAARTGLSRPRFTENEAKAPAEIFWSMDLGYSNFQAATLSKRSTLNVGSNWRFTQLSNAHRLKNYLGDKEISGCCLAQQFRNWNFEIGKISEISHR